MPEDIKKVIYDVLRHRIILSYEAYTNEKTVDEIIMEVMESVELP